MYIISRQHLTQILRTALLTEWYSKAENKRNIKYCRHHRNAADTLAGHETQYIIKHHADNQCQRQQKQQLRSYKLITYCKPGTAKQYSKAAADKKHITAVCTVSMFGYHASQQKTCRKKQRIGIGDIFCCHTLEENENDQCPQQQKFLLLFQAALSLPPPFIGSPGNQSAPRKQRQQIYQRIIIKYIVTWMLGNSCAQEVVRTKEGIDEVAAVQTVHNSIPGHSNRGTQQCAAYKMHALQDAPVTLPQKKHSNNKARQQYANRSFSQNRKACCTIHNIPIARPAVTIPQIEKQQRRTEEKEQHRVRNHGLADKEKFHTAQQHQRTEKAAARIFQLAGAPRQ